MPLKDLTGKQFGQLIVLYRTKDHITKNGRSVVMWHCKCSCGNYVDIMGDCLKSGHTKSCGCYRKKATSERSFVNLTGETFGRLTVLQQAENYISPKGKEESQWMCQCICGNVCVVRNSALRSGNTQSCGCLLEETKIKNIEIIHQKLKKYNTYDLSGEYGIGYSEEGNVFYFDLEDYDKIKDYYWNYHDKKDHHVIGRITDSKTNKQIPLHRFIMNVDENLDLVVDHINTHHPEDNRKANLRIVTSSENQMNRKLAKNNTSGTTGVLWDKRNNLWMAYIGINYKTITLGYYKIKEDAIKARKEAEEKYFGEHSYDNSQKQWKENFCEEQNLS